MGKTRTANFLLEIKGRNILLQLMLKMEKNKISYKRLTILLLDWIHIIIQNTKENRDKIKWMN